MSFERPAGLVIPPRYELFFFDLDLLPGMLIGDVLAFDFDFVDSVDLALDDDAGERFFVSFAVEFFLIFCALDFDRDDPPLDFFVFVFVVLLAGGGSMALENGFAESRLAPVPDREKLR